MVIEKLPCFRKFIGGRDFIIPSGAVSAEKRIQPGGFCNFGHIGSCGVMGFIRKTVWIVKVRILAAKQFGTPVHKFGEFFYRAGNFFCNSHRHLICGLEHNCHQRLISGKYLTWSSVNAGVTGRYTGGCILGNSNFCLDVQIFAGQKRCHDFCNTGRIKLCIPVFGIKDRFCIYIHENCSLGFHIWAFRPSVNGISVCRL